MKMCGWCAAIAASTSGLASAAPRDVQMVRVDFLTSVMELRNVGTTAEPLAGWRFCSHDENQVRVYSAVAGLNAVTLQPGASLFIHFGNDAPAGDPARINASTIGAFASPFDRGPFAIQLYFPPVSFSNGNQIADAMQWSFGGFDDGTADERSDEAEVGGVWTDQDAWISTTFETESIDLNAASIGLVLHGPADYTANEPGAGPCNIADIAADFGVLNVNDIIDFVNGFNAGAASADVSPPGGDGLLNVNDVIDFVNAFNAGCP